MKTIRNIEEIPELINPVVTIGSFDGVHLGHKSIINTTLDMAQKIHGQSIVVSFSPHPQSVLHPGEKGLYILSTAEEKIQLLESLGIDILLIIPFTKEFAATPYDIFIKNIIVGKLHAKVLVVGYDHHFGSNREGSIKQLLKLSSDYPFGVIEVPAQNKDEITVSSTKIRKALASGEIETANAYLGYPYSIKGIVVHGNQIGRKLGFPTANIEPEDPMKLVPADGVYAVMAEVEGKVYNGMLNTGIRPTTDGISKVTEVNIFDFSDDIYGQEIKITFIKRIRGEVKFAGMTELQEQLMKDKKNVLKILSEKKS